jgi:anti-sigma B factor antagonist
METLGGRQRRPQLRFDRSTSADGTTCLAVAGEVDMNTGDSFRQKVFRVLDEPGVNHLVLDLAPLRFIDSNGVATLLKARRAADQQGVRFGIIRADGAIRNVLEILGVYSILSTEERT